MKFFGLEIKRARKNRMLATTEQKQLLAPVDSSSWWFPIIRESFSGAWQTNTELTTESKLAYFAVFACITLISGDIAKLRAKVMRKANGVKKEVERDPIALLLKKPNTYQTGYLFREFWVMSKLSRGNTYGLKERDRQGNIAAVHVLDPTRVTPLVADDGSVFYRLKKDNLSKQMDEDIIVPAREIFHDRMNCLFHPLVGISPLYASSAAASQGTSIQDNQVKFFNNAATPSGILTAPGNIKQSAVDTIRQQWYDNYSGDNYGRVAVLGNDLKFTPITVNAQDSQLVEQLNLSAEIICATFHVQPWMIGFGQPPTYNNIETLYLAYYNQALQTVIESMEATLDDGLGLFERELSIELDIDVLLRMDTKTRYETHKSGIGAGWLAPNEVRQKENYAPVEGGDSPYLQQQNYSLEALAGRDATNPLAVKTQPQTQQQSPTPETSDPQGDTGEDSADQQAAFEATQQILKYFTDCVGQELERL